jgi:hypothetical protein
VLRWDREQHDHHQRLRECDPRRLARRSSAGARLRRRRDPPVAARRRAHRRRGVCRILRGSRHLPADLGDR